MISVVELVILLVVVAVVAVAISRRRPGGVRRRARPRHIVVRIVCGALAAVILVALGVGSWQEVRRAYPEASEGSKASVRVPTQPAPVPAIDARRSRVEVGKARLLFRIVVVDSQGGLQRPLHVAQHAFDWPSERGRAWATDFEVEGTRVSTRVSVLRVEARRRGNGQPPQIEARISYSLSRESGWSRGSSSGTSHLAVGQVSHRHPLSMGGRPSPRPLSLVAGPAPHLSACYHFELAASGDPLAEMPLGKWMAAHEAESRDSAQQGVHASVGHRWSPELDAPVRGFALAAHLGASSLLLFVAAGLLAQLFTRRSLAFVAMLAAVVLYAAAVERVALGTHLSHMENADAPLPTRLAGCTRAPDTFFYRRTALRRVQTVADDAEAPEALRTFATETARAITASLPGKP